MDFNITDKLLIRLSAFIRCLRKKWEGNETVHPLVIEFGVPIKLVNMIKICLDET
jgi:hypothetical protein